jgi:hypothetical protein
MIWPLKNPDKLKELQAAFDAEAKKFNVYPLDDRFAERGDVRDRPSLPKGKSEFVYLPGTVRVPEGTAPNVKAKSHRITIEFENTGGHANGVLVAAGGSAGYTIFVKNGALTYENNFFGRERDVLQSHERLPAGSLTVAFEYTQEAKDYGGGGTGRLFVNGKNVGEGKFAHVPPVRYSATETLDIGMDLGEAVSNQYHGPNPFTGKLKRVKFEILPTEQHGKIEDRVRAASLKVWRLLE